MSDDRLARVLHAYWGETPGRVRSSMTTSALRFGLMWADANPKPHTITLSQSEAILEAGRAGRYEDHEAALRAAGIEVVDDE